VADHVVDRRADRLRKTAIAERRGDRAMVLDELVTEPVELGGGHARLDMGRDEIERFGRQPAGAAHAFESFGAVKLDRALVAPPIVDAVVLDIAGAAHGPYLACDTGRNKTGWARLAVRARSSKVLKTQRKRAPACPKPPSRPRKSSQPASSSSATRS